jgi:hypothetical protein
VQGRKQGLSYETLVYKLRKKHEFYRKVTALENRQYIADSGVYILENTLPGGGNIS